MLDDFHPGFPALNDATLRNYANWSPEQRAEYEERKARAAKVLESIRERRNAARGEEL